MLIPIYKFMFNNIKHPFINLVHKYPRMAPAVPETQERLYLGQLKGVRVVLEDGRAEITYRVQPRKAGRICCKYHHKEAYPF